jgi:hypothetical protein
LNYLEDFTTARGKGEDEKYNIHAKKASIDRSLQASLAACVNARGSTGF